MPAASRSTPTFAESRADPLEERPGSEVIQGDFTRLEPDRTVQPDPHEPPLRATPPSRPRGQGTTRAIASDRLGLAISGLAGLYAHFLLLGDAWLADGGLAVWLIPSEFMDVNYGAALKTYLTERVTLRQIHRYCPSDVQFGDAMVTSAIVVFDKTPPPSGHEVRMSFGGPLSTPAASESVPLATLRSARKWTAFPGNGARRPSPATTLGDFFTIKRGLATGANAFFILERAEARRRGIPEAFLKPILPGSRHLRQDVIEADADGYPRLERSLVVIDCDLPEDCSATATRASGPTSRRAGSRASLPVTWPAAARPGTPRSNGTPRRSCAPTWDDREPTAIPSGSSGTSSRRSPPTST